MDYPFLLKKLITLSPQLLRRYEEALSYDEMIPHPDFTAGKHPGFCTLTDLEKFHDLVEQTKREVDGWLPREACKWHEINVLLPGAVLHEHTDLGYDGFSPAGDDDELYMEVVVTHKVHVLLSGEAVYRGRRSKHEPMTELPIEAGGVYLLNNYVWHEVANISEIKTRAALTLAYADKTWRLRRNIFQRLKITGQNQYQL